MRECVTENLKRLDRYQYHAESRFKSSRSRPYVLPRLHHDDRFLKHVGGSEHLRALSAVSSEGDHVGCFRFLFPHFDAALRRRVGGVEDLQNSLSLFSKSLTGG